MMIPPIYNCEKGLLNQFRTLDRFNFCSISSSVWCPMYGSPEGTWGFKVKRQIELWNMFSLIGNPFSRISNSFNRIEKFVINSLLIRYSFVNIRYEQSVLSGCNSNALFKSRSEVTICLNRENELFNLKIRETRFKIWEMDCTIKFTNFKNLHVPSRLS